MDSERVHPLFLCLLDSRIQRLDRVWIVCEMKNPEIGYILSKSRQKSSKGFGWFVVTIIQSVFWPSIWFLQIVWRVPDLCLILQCRKDKEIFETAPLKSAAPQQSPKANFRFVFGLHDPWHVATKRKSKGAFPYKSVINIIHLINPYERIWNTILSFKN